MSKNAADEHVGHNRPRSDAARGLYLNPAHSSSASSSWLEFSGTCYQISPSD